MDVSSTSSIESGDWRDELTWYTEKTLLVRILRLLGPTVLSALMRTERVGFENVPARGACILAPNHVSSWDPVVVALLLPRHSYFMAKQELFHNPIMRRLFRWWGAFPVKRGKGDQWALAQAGRVLEAGRMLCMFPEGTRSRDNAQLRRGKLGTVRLALECRAPVVPTALIGTQLLRPAVPRMPITIRVGQPIDMVAMAGDPPYEIETQRELTAVLMREIAAMLPPEQRGAYG